jgi:hypothetical protein
MGKHALWLLLFLGCSGCSGGNTTTAGSCKTLQNLCSKMPIADLRTAFGVPGLMSGREENSDDSAPLGPRNLCHYSAPDSTTGGNIIQFDLIYSCFKAGAAAATNNFDSLKTAIETDGGTSENLTGLGDAAYWHYTSGTVPDSFVQAMINLRSGAVYLQLTGYSQSTSDANGPHSLSTADAKPLAVDAMKKFLAFVSTAP